MYAIGQRLRLPRSKQKGARLRWHTGTRVDIWFLLKTFFLYVIAGLTVFTMGEVGETISVYHSTSSDSSE